MNRDLGGSHVKWELASTAAQLAEAKPDSNPAVTFQTFMKHVVVLLCFLLSRISNDCPHNGGGASQ